MHRLRFILIWTFCLTLMSCSAATQSSTPPVVVVKPHLSASITARPVRSVLPAPSPSGQGSATPGYHEYANPRYGFTALWPSSFKPQPPPEDADGQAWTSPDGQAELAAYGANNVLGYSPGQDEAADARLLSVTYTNISGDIVTVSGYKNNGRIIVYQRDMVGSGSIDTLYWTYPASQKAQWNAAVTLTALTFQPGDVTTPHRGLLRRGEPAYRQPRADATWVRMVSMTWVL